MTGYSEGAVDFNGVGYLSQWLSVFVAVVYLAWGGDIGLRAMQLFCSCIEYVMQGGPTINKTQSQSGSVLMTVCYISFMTSFGVLGIF